jgi:CheY-like chemotaxis protein
LAAKLRARARNRMSTNLHLSKTVLLVDDLDTLRRMVRDFVKTLGMEVLETSNAGDAIHTARSHPGTIDLLLTDIDMPRMSGWESSKQISALRPAISNSVYVRWDQPPGMERLQGKAGWDLFHSKTVSLGGIKGALDRYFFGMRNDHRLPV